MKRCKHPAAKAYVTSEPAPGAEYDMAISVRCGVCHARLRIGPALDTPETAIELRAAEIAALVADAKKKRKRVFLSKPYVGCNGTEISGWIIAQYDSAKAPEQPGEYAGYLARIIYEHGKEEA